MARKTATKKRAATPAPITESVEAAVTPEPEAAVTPEPAATPAPPEPRFVRKVLTRGELDSLARWAAEAKYADIYTELKERDRKTLLARIDPKNELEPIDKALANARAAKAKAASKYVSVAQAASQRLGVDVTQYGYDDETGLLSTTPIPK